MEIRILIKGGTVVDGSGADASDTDETQASAAE